MSVEDKGTARAVVIGSGFGGAIAAHRLANAGIETIMLERGRRWRVTKKQGPFCTYRKPDGRAAWLSPETVLFEPKPIDVYVGLLERIIGDGITVWAAAAVGGGSIVYNTVLLKPSEAAFRRVFPKEVEYEEMQRYYSRVARVIRPARIPKDVLETDYYLSTRVFLEQARAAGLPATLIDIGSSWDVVREEIQGKREASAIAGEIWYGINSGAKRSLDHNYLARAERSGKVDVRPLHRVTEVAEAPKGGYRVSYERIDERGAVLETGSIGCRYLFLAAGSIGTSKLLVRARETGALPRLNSDVGRYWGNNGDTFATRNAGVRTNPGQGGPATAAIMYEDNPYSPQTLIVYPEWDAPEGTLTSLGMGIASEFGEFRYDAGSDEVRLTWDSQAPGVLNLLDAANYTYKLLDAVVPQTARDSFGGRTFNSHYASQPTGYPQRSAKAAVGSETKANAGITAHPLGGAVMGKACDLFGRVDGYSGLYVVDGAFIPGYAGAVNPAFTISAFAERSMEHIVANDLCDE